MFQVAIVWCMVTTSHAVMKWLAESDPSIRWQLKCDLLDIDSEEYTKDRSLVTTIGWGAKFLSLQDQDGRWGGGLYGPKFISTHYTLLILRRMGMLPNEQTDRACDQLLRMPYLGGVDHPYKNAIGASKHKEEICITGMALGIVSHFSTGEEYYDRYFDTF